MAKLQITVCDICHAPDRKTIRYRIGKTGASRQFDLCEEHAKPVEGLLKMRQKTPSGSAYRRFEDQVATIEEIEAKKRQRKQQ